MRKFWRSTATALFLATTLGGCNSSGGKRHLPAAPELFGRPVPLRTIRTGDGAKAALAAERADHVEANRRLENDGAFYRDVRGRFGARDGGANGERQ
jgi:hypothetical protein